MSLHEVNYHQQILTMDQLTPLDPPLRSRPGIRYQKAILLTRTACVLKLSI